MEEENLRKMAIEQFLQGKSPVSIYRDMGRSKFWFFKWLHRGESVARKQAIPLEESTPFRRMKAP